MRRSMPTTTAVVALLLTGCGDDGTRQLNPARPIVTTPATAAAPDDTTPSPETATHSSSAPSTTERTSAPPATTPARTDTATAPPTTTEDTMTNEPTDTRPPQGSSVDRAIADLADRLGIDPSSIEIVSVEEVDWPDGSIGCPEPGMVYTQAIVNGSRIVLSYDGVDYDYHEGGRRDVFYCPDDRVETDTPPSADLDV